MNIQVTMNLRFNLIIGLLFILAGLLLCSPYLVGCYKSTVTCHLLEADVAAHPDMHPPTMAANSTHSTIPITGSPVHITIPSVGIDIGVEHGVYDATRGDWTISTDKAYFATVTSQPNTTAGNTFIYGHNRSNIFRNLLDIQVGDRATVTTDNGYDFTYEFASKLDTTPSDVSLFSYEGAPILTLQTCTGIWDQNRSLFTFNLVEVR